MSNADFNDDPNKRRDSSKGDRLTKGGPPGKVRENVANWPGLPGKTGPNRSEGVTKLKIYPASKGI